MTLTYKRREIRTNEFVQKQTNNHSMRVKSCF